MSIDTSTQKTDDIKFNCTHCQQHISTGIDTAGMEAQCPACGGTIVVPSGEPPKGDSLHGEGKSSSRHQSSRHTKRNSSDKQRGFPKTLVMSLTIAAVIGAAYFFFIRDNGGSVSDEQASSENPSVFLNRTSDKSEVMGLRGGMSKSEAILTLGIKSLKPATDDGKHHERWKSPYPGFEAFQYDPGKSFPIAHVEKIRLVFLNDRLQSVCYVFKRRDCIIEMHKGEGDCGMCGITHWFIPYTRKPYGAKSYDRFKLTADIMAATDETFEKIEEISTVCSSKRIYDKTLMSPEEDLVPDYTSGRSIPKGGRYKIEYKNRQYVDSIQPIFYAASKNIFVRFEHALENKDSILQDLAIESNRPIMVRVERRTSEYFLLRFSFRNTYKESLTVGGNYRIQAEQLEAEKDERKRHQTTQEEKEKKRLEEERIKKLREGL